MYSFEKLSTDINTLTEKYPFARSEAIGSSRLGKPLYAVCIGHGKRTVGYNAAHHANEWLTTPILMQFLEEYCQHNQESPTPNFLDRITLCAIPMVNPDGVTAVQKGEKPQNWKANATGVDLNANYPASWEVARINKFARGFTRPGPKGYVGEYPLSEPETAAMAAYTYLRNFSLTLSLHTQGEEIYWRYRNYAPANAKKIALAMEAASGYPCAAVPDEACHGGYRDWFIEKFNRPGFTIECGLGENPLPWEDFAGIYEKVVGILWAGLALQ